MSMYFKKVICNNPTFTIRVSINLFIVKSPLDWTSFACWWILVQNVQTLCKAVARTEGQQCHEGHPITASHDVLFQSHYYNNTRSEITLFLDEVTCQMFLRDAVLSDNYSSGDQCPCSAGVSDGKPNTIWYRFHTQLHK